MEVLQRRTLKTMPNSPSPIFSPRRMSAGSICDTQACIEEACRTSAIATAGQVLTRCESRESLEGSHLPLAHDRLLQGLDIEDLVVHKPPLQVLHLQQLRDTSIAAVLS